MNVEMALAFVDHLLFEKTGKHLSTLQSSVFRESWIGSRYDEIAQLCGFSETHIRTVGSELWELLTSILGELVTKKNFRAAIERQGRVLQSTSSLQLTVPSSSLSFSSDQVSDHVLVHQSSATPPGMGVPVDVDLEFPEGQVGLGSAFYSDRPPIEIHCYQAIMRPGALLRIKAPCMMGKTSLLARILSHAQQQGYKTVFLNFQLVDARALEDLDRFLQWLCARVSRELGLASKIEEYWDDVFGSKTSCHDYFESYVLAQINEPLVLALDDVDSLFQHSLVADHFFALLRAWHEIAKNSLLWQKLRLVLVHSTEVYIPLQIHQSPFNVGQPIDLPEFTFEQVQELAQKHGLHWPKESIAQLIDLVGGHPYLIRLAFYTVASQQMSCEEFLRLAPLDSGPYGHYLRRLLHTLQEQPKLTAILKQILAQCAPTLAWGLEIFQLQRLGLICWQDEQIKPRCTLYQKYLGDRL